MTTRTKPAVCRKVVPLRRGLRFDGPCLVLADGAWDDKAAIWVQLVDRKHRAVEQLGLRVVNFRTHAIFRCDDGKIRASTFEAFRAMRRHEDDRWSA